MQCVHCMLLFLVLVVNSARLRILHSYTLLLKLLLLSEAEDTYGTIILSFNAHQEF